MKDITPPKLSPAVQQAPTTATSSVAKQLYPMSPLFNSFMKSQAASNEAKAESKCEQATNTSTLNGINGLLASSIENKPGEQSILFLFNPFLIINSLLTVSFYFMFCIHQAGFTLRDNLP